MALFLSTYVNKLDKKGRVSIPALYRQTLTAATPSFPGVVLFRSYKLPCIEACSLSRMEALSQSIDHLDLFSDTQDDLAATIFADAEQVSFDGEGRILLSAAMIRHAKLDENVSIIGRGPTFQLWNPTDFERHQKDARDRALKSKATLKLQNKDSV